MGSVNALHSPKGAFGLEKPLPVTADGLAAAWFADILDREVIRAAIKKEIHGTVSKIMVELEYVDNTDGLPRRPCVKGGFNPELMRLIPPVLTCSRLETQFYYHIALKTGMNLPKTYCCGTESLTIRD